MRRDRNPSEARLRSVARKHKPKGWTVRERDVPFEVFTTLGSAVHHERRIETLPLTDRQGLFVFLHECGHVHCKHGARSDLPRWQEEYEAECYAIDAMHAAGIAVPRLPLQEGRHNVAAQIPADATDIPARVLQFAYGRKWRDHE